MTNTQIYTNRSQKTAIIKPREKRRRKEKKEKKGRQERSQINLAFLIAKEGRFNRKCIKKMASSFLASFFPLFSSSLSSRGTLCALREAHARVAVP